MCHDESALNGFGVIYSSAPFYVHSASRGIARSAVRPAVRQYNFASSQYAEAFQLVCLIEFLWFYFYHDYSIARCSSFLISTLLCALDFSGGRRSEIAD